MSFILRIAVVAAIILGVSQLYNSSQYRPQLDEAWRQILLRLNQIEEEINQQVGLGPTGDLGPQKVSISVPRSKASDWQTVGAMGHTILSGDGTIKLEIDYTAHSKPTATDLSTISSVIQKYSGKNISVSYDTGNLPENSNYTLQQIVELTKDHRSCYSTSSQVCLYLLFLPGTLEGSNALGASFTATAAVFFTDQMSKGTGPLLSRDRVARATTTHELGHLFGLVNLTYTSPRAREDAGHPGHSNNPGSVMYWAVESLSLGSVLSGGPPVNFDANDEADISDIKTGVK